MEEKKNVVKITIEVDDTALDKAMKKAKELSALLRKIGSMSIGEE